MHMTKLPTDIQSKIADIKKHEALIDQLRAEVRAWFDEVSEQVRSIGLGDSPSTPEVGPPTRPTKERPRGSGRQPKGSKPQMELIADVVNGAPSRAWRPADVHRALTEQGVQINLPTVRSGLSKARTDGLIQQKVKRGPYYAKVTEPNKEDAPADGEGAS
jgi:hypothetical protein